MNIGVGVCSYKRPELATNTCKSILGTIDRTKHTITTICSVDDSDISGYEWISQNFSLIHGENKGIAYNKNRLLKYLEGNDVIFLAEDDIIFSKEGWIDLYLQAIHYTGFQHFNFIVPDYQTFIKRTVSYEGITLGDSGAYVNGVLMVISKTCMERVGGFDNRYLRYGYEHADYTNRCKAAGVYPTFHIHVMEATPYIMWIPSASCIPEEEKKIYIKHNAKLFHSKLEKIYNDSYKEVTYI
jgi:GT2 family glycosyltransferase